MSTTQARRATIRRAEPAAPTLALQVQRPHAGTLGDVVHVHGSTFGADLSVFCRLDGPCWADAMNVVGLTVWGLSQRGLLYNAVNTFLQRIAT